MKRLFSLFFCLLGSAITIPAIAADNSFINTIPAQYRFTYDRVKMPDGDPSMGLLGIHYLLSVPYGFYAGLGGYGSIHGSQGGLLVLGIEGGWEYLILPKLSLDAGIFAGGGGGGAAPIGGGLMINPHIGFNYDFGYFRLGPQYSYISFPGGKIHSSQLGLFAEIPTAFDYIDSSKYGQTITLPDNWITHNYVAFFEQNNFQRSGTKATNGGVQDDTFRAVGFEVGHYWTPNIFTALKTSGAFSGIPSGYMDVLGGLGYREPLTEALALTTVLYAGAGGGGKVDTGSGLLIQPTVGMQWYFASQWGLWLEGGYLDAPKGELRAPSLTLKLFRFFDGISQKNTSSNAPTSNYTVDEWRVRVMNQTYFHPERTDKTAKSNINLVGAAFDQLLTPYFYITGQAASAYAGKDQTTGGPATGLVGIGMQSKIWKEHWQVFAEGLIGASGGGGYDTGGGSITEPVVGINYFFNSTVGIQASVGRMFALKQSTSNTTANLGLVFSFGAPTS